MKLSLDWIQDYVGAIDDSPKDIGSRMTLATAEIEGIEYHGEDPVYDIDNKSLTHRPDLWGHYGFAREFAAVYRKPLKPLKELTRGDWSYPETAQDPLQVFIEVDADICPRYSAVVIDGIEVGPSPQWLVDRLDKVGARSINNIVDLTNYVMFELGQPIHAFDRQLLKGDILKVRLASDGETFTALDDSEHKLKNTMMVIADSEKAVSLAGVMGGANSEVHEGTTTLVLEVANFHPTHVRRTAAALNMRSEASMRFEKGLDPLQLQTATDRFMTLLKTLCPNAQMRTPFLSTGLANKPVIAIDTSFGFINQRLGTQLPHSEIRDILERLWFGVEATDAAAGDQGPLSVTVPSFRATGDVSIAMDLVEEVGRVYGYDNIEAVAPHIPVQPVEMSPRHRLQRRIREVLSRDLAFYEVYNYAFVGDQLLEAVGLDPKDHIALANPLASDQNRLRTSLIPNLLKITGENLRFQKDFQCYELERTFANVAQGDFDHDRFALAGIMTQKAWSKQSEQCFYALKGAIEDLFAQLPFADRLRFRPAAVVPSWGHPGRTAQLLLGEEVIGTLGQVHPQVTENLGIKAIVGFFDIDVDALLACQSAEASFEKVQRYPTVPFDISMICEAKTLIADVEDTIWSVDAKVKAVELFDVYVGENIGEGKKSLAFKITFAANDHTLQPDEITDVQQRTMQALDAAGYKVRDGAA
jgi:phenylalanyl-tRNA synthetase beta chain